MQRHLLNLPHRNPIKQKSNIANSARNNTSGGVFLSCTAIIFVKRCVCLEKVVILYLIMLVIFDLDGTLLNTISDLGMACNYALKRHGFPIHVLADYPKLVGNGVNRLISRALPPEARDENTVLRLRESFVEYYETHNTVHTLPYKGIPELLASLRSQGHKLAVASNKYQRATTMLVEYYFGKGTFDVVLGERDGVPRKPDPRIVGDIRERAGVSLPALYVGDSDVDIATARNAGVPIVACSWGFVPEEKLRELQPDYLVSSPARILQIVAEREAGRPL